MEKPVSVRMTELKNNMLYCMQDSELSPVLMLPIIKEIHEMIGNYAEAQCQNEKAAYEQFLQEESKKKQEDKANEN